MPTKIPLMGLSACLLLTACTMSNVALAQVVVDNAATAGESYARGMSDIISAQGEYNLSTSQAAINAEKAASMNIENRKQWTDTYFEMRKTNKKYRDEERDKPPSMEAMARYAQAGMPKRLTPNEFNYVTGKITWPSVFKQNQYQEERTQLDDLFGKRAQVGGISFEDQMAIRQATNVLSEKLTAQIRDMPPKLFMASKHFIESLAYEGQLPPSG